MATMNNTEKALVGSFVVIIVFAGFVLLGDHRPAEDLRAKHPEYASVLNGNSEHDYCVLQTGPRLSDTRRDYVAAADAVCKAGPAIVAATRH